MIGFLFTVVPFILLFSFFGTDFEGHVDPWWCYLQAASYLIYRILDEMDGKQARKTGNSSPLGLLFDHGCDSFTTALITLMLSKLMQVGNSGLIFLALLASTGSFYFSTLEEYYTGGLFLGVGNGVTDGSLPIILIFLYCGAAGNQIFKEIITISFKESVLEISLAHAFVYAILFSQIIAVL